MKTYKKNADQQFHFYANPFKCDANGAPCNPSTPKKVKVTKPRFRIGQGADETVEAGEPM